MADTPKIDSPKDNDKELDHFTVSEEGVSEIGKALEALLPNKYIIQTIFNVMNDVLKPVFKK